MIEIILTSSVLILLVAVLRRVLRGRISPGVQYALWLLVAARLLIPGTLFDAPVSVMGAAENLRETTQWSTAAAAAPPSGSGPAAGFVTLPQYSGDSPAAPFATKSPASRQAEDLLSLLWKTGMAVTAAALVISNLTFYIRLRKNRKRLDLPAAPWTGDRPVYESDVLPSPCLFGVFRPAIYLNEAAMDARHPEHILAHEYTHYRHGDHLWSLLRSVCLVVHWYNPLVWWAASLSRQDCELACDAAVLRKLGEEESIDYGQTLLSMVSKSRTPSALLHTATTMSAGKRAMKQRIALIVNRPKMRKITLLLVALLACLLAACTFGSKAEPAGTPAEPGDAREMPIAVSVGQTASSNLNDYSLITDPDEVKRLWELYQSFEYEGPYDPTGKGGWFVDVTFGFGDEPNDDRDIFFILTQDGVHTMDGEDLLLKNIDEIYAEFLRVSTSNPIQPVGASDTEEVLANNAWSIVEHIQSGADAGEWLPLMNYMDWRIIYQAMVNAGDYNDEDLAPVMMIMDEIEQYINRQLFAMTTAEYLYILTATEGLDGAYSEKYGYLVYRMYEVNPSQFAHVVLNMLPEPQQTAVLDFFRGEWYYHRISDSPDVPTREETIEQLAYDLTGGISAAPLSGTLHSPGDTYQFLVLGASGMYALEYSSSDTGVATVDQNGVITAVAPGEAVISVHYEGAGGPVDFSSVVYCDW